MLTKSPEAYDPHLQDKIDMLQRTPEEYHLRYEIDQIKSHIEQNIRMIRALNREVERNEKSLQALELALMNIREIKKEQADT